MFEADALKVNAADTALVDAVAKLLTPSAWDDRPMLKPSADGTKYVVDDAMTAEARRVNERNRDHARDTAITIIDMVRTFDPVAQG